MHPFILQMMLRLLLNRFHRANPQEAPANKIRAYRVRSWWSEDLPLFTGILLGNCRSHHFHVLPCAFLAGVAEITWIQSLPNTWPFSWCFVSISKGCDALMHLQMGWFLKKTHTFWAMKPICLGCTECTVTVFNEPGSAMGLRSLSEAQKRVLQGTKAQRQGWKDGSHVRGQVQDVSGLSIYSPRPPWAIPINQGRA